MNKLQNEAKAAEFVAKLIILISAVVIIATVLR